MSLLTTCSSIYCMRGGEVLLLQRRKPPFVGYWIAPGGKINSGESPYEAARRELQEETGLRALDLSLRGIIVETSPVPDWQWLIFYYVATRFEGQIFEESPEGKLAWWAMEKVDDLRLPDADRLFMTPILDLGAPVYQARFRYNEEKRLVDFVEHTAVAQKWSKRSQLSAFVLCFLRSAETAASALSISPELSITRTCSYRSASCRYNSRERVRCVSS